MVVLRSRCAVRCPGLAVDRDADAFDGDGVAVESKPPAGFEPAHQLLIRCAPRLPPENPSIWLTISDKWRSSTDGVCAGKRHVSAIDDKRGMVAVGNKGLSVQVVACFGVMSKVTQTDPPNNPIVSGGIRLSL
jgi:hypothetical protein